MTYNWNTMVEVTVPTGTNGWLYSGELIINGVKVRFPVGVPTSVPEPAAVLLQKMIEMEQEEDANTAKPQNHYVGDVTIPAGKTLPLEKGAKFVDNSGPSEVVILPETDLTHDGGDDPQYIITTLPSAVPVDGVPVDVTYNGVVYTSPVLHVKEGDYDVYVIGNFEILGETGGNSDAPFGLVLVPAGEDGVYGRCVVIDAPQKVTISIVQTGGAASGGGSSGGGSGVCVVTVTADTENMSDFTNVKADKTFTEMRAAYESGGLLWCRLIVTMTSGTLRYECTHSATVLEATEYAMPMFVFKCVAMPTTGVAIKDDDSVWVMNEG